MKIKNLLWLETIIANNGRCPTGPNACSKCPLRNFCDSKLVDNVDEWIHCSETLKFEEACRQMRDLKVKKLRRLVNASNRRRKN